MKSNRGFTLIELMVGVGLTGLISLGVMQLISDTGKISKSTKQQFEEDELTRVLNSLFNNEKVCRSTLFGKDPTGDVGSKIDEVIRLKSIDNIKVFQENPADPTDTDDIDPPEQSQYDTMRLSSTEKRVMVRANCPDTGSASSRAPCTYAMGSQGRIFLKEIRILAYEMTHSDAINPGSPYKNSANQATLEFELVKGSFIGKNEDSLSEEEKIRLRKGTYGDQTIKKRIPITVSVDSNNKITNCEIELKSYVSDACSQLDGIHESNSADPKWHRRCKNIKIQSIDGTKPAITSIENVETQGLTQVQEGNDTYLGDFTTAPSPAWPNDNSSIQAMGQATISSHLNILNGTLEFGTSAQADTAFPGKNKVQIKNTGTNELTISGNNTDEGVYKLGKDLTLHGRNGKIGLNTNNPDSSFHINDSGHLTGDLTVDENTHAKRALFIESGSNTATIRMNGSFLEISGVPVIIPNQPYSDAKNKASSDPKKDLVASRDFVYEMFADRLGNEAINEFINEIIEDTITSNYTVNQLNSVKKSICNRTQNGTVSGSSKCIINAGKTCPSSTPMLKRIDGNGNIICVSRNPGTDCPFGQVPSSFNSDGTVNCTLMTTVISEVHKQIYDPARQCQIKLNVAKYYNKTYRFSDGRCQANWNGVGATFFDGCGAAWNHDSGGECNSHCSAAGGSCLGSSNGCTYNWVVVGYKCRCKRPDPVYTDTFYCTPTGCS
jgi:prepilin-type N-terminal cleavage/methylation domain-containing protein